MSRKKGLLKISIANGFVLSLRNILYIGAYWLTATVIFYILMAPLSAIVDEIGGASDISADTGHNSYIKTFFLADILPRLSARSSSAMNPLLIFGGFLFAFGAGIFFTGGFLESFRVSLSRKPSGRIALRETEKPSPRDFTQGGLNHFPALLLFFLCGATAFLLLNTLTSSAGRFLKAIAWGITKNEGAAYYTGAGVRIAYYLLFFYLAMFLQYARIAAVFSKPRPKEMRLRAVMYFKDGLRMSYDFLSDNKYKAIGLYLIILMGAALWFVVDHLIFFSILKNGGFNPMIWSALSGLGYIFFRFLQYAVAAVLFHSRSYL